MRIYISGKISGLNYSEVQTTFQDAQEMLEELGFDVVNPLNNGLPQEAHWNEHIVKDIEMLLPCDAIFMMSNWVDSTGARCEYHIAQETQKITLFEENKKEILPFTKLVGDDKTKALRVYMAMLEVTNLRLFQYIGKDRTSKEFFARLILIWNLHVLDINVRVIANFVNRSPDAVYRCIKKYDDEYRFNQNFRKLADKITNKLKENEA